MCGRNNKYNDFNIITTFLDIDHIKMEESDISQNW